VPAEIFLLALGAMFWPLLLAVDIVAFQAPRPVTILGWFLVGGFLTTVSLGIAIVYALRSTTLVTRSRSATDAWVDITVGVLAVVAALVLRRRPTPAPAEPATGSDRLASMLARGAGLAFVAGIVFNVVPGVLPFIALKDIAELGYPPAGTVAVIVGFYVVMFTFVEAPLVGFVVAPARTTAAVTSFNAWLSMNWRALAAWALGVVGAFEIVRGLAAALG
jgi:hypothetical protein